MPKKKAQFVRAIKKVTVDGESKVVSVKMATAAWDRLAPLVDPFTGKKIPKQGFTQVPEGYNDEAPETLDAAAAKIEADAIKQELKAAQQKIKELEKSAEKAEKSAQVKSNVGKTEGNAKPPEGNGKPPSK